MRCLSKLFVKTAQIVVSDVVRNIDDLLPQRKAKRRFSNPELMKIRARAEAVVFFELPRQMFVRNVQFARDAGDRRIDQIIFVDQPLCL